HRRSVVVSRVATQRSASSRRYDQIVDDFRVAVESIGYDYTVTRGSNADNRVVNEAIARSTSRSQTVNLFARRRGVNFHYVLHDNFIGFTNDANCATLYL